MAMLSPFPLSPIKPAFPSGGDMSISKPMDSLMNKFDFQRAEGYEPLSISGGVAIALYGL